MPSTRLKSTRLRVSTTYSCKHKKLTWTRLTPKEGKCGHRSSSNNEKTRWLLVMQQTVRPHSSNMWPILMISMIWRRLLCPIKVCHLAHRPTNRKEISRDEDKHRQMDTSSNLVKLTQTTAMNSVRITALGLEI